MIKSIFARPVFINPQAYLVIPQLANLSMLEPIDFTSTNTYSFESLGKVESKIISAKDEYILHIDLYELYGSCVLGEFYIGPATIGSIDDFTITTNGYITTMNLVDTVIEVGGGDSGNIVYPGLIAAWSAKGKTNDDEDRAILKDLTGNGHDITLNGFAFSAMSGYGGYDNIISNGTVNSTYCDKINNVEITVKQTHPSVTSTLAFNRPSTNKAIYEIKGLVDGQVIHFGNDGSKEKILSVSKDGIYEVNWNDLYNINSSYYRCIYLDYNGDINCTIKNLPLYDGALLFDGVDDYGINENMPILDDFTLIIKNKWFDLTRDESFLISKSTPAGADGAFILGRKNSLKCELYYSYYEPNRFNYQTSDLLYITPKSYNGNNAVRGTNKDSNVLNLGTIRKNDISRKFVGAFYSAYLFDRSLDEQEIKEFIRKYIDPEYLLPSEQTTE